jgi:hypothetical protein
MVTAETYDDKRVFFGVAVQLDAMIHEITAEEFRWEDAHHDRNSAVGRELLFLISNDEWVGSSTEKVSIARSDVIGTTIEIDVDLDRITHDAFQGRSGFLWLPVLITPSRPGPGYGSGHDATATKVVDANGTTLVALPDVDVQHCLAAALSDILIDLAVGPLFAVAPHNFGQSRDYVSGTRDNRLLLSAAIYRLLRGEHVDHTAIAPSRLTHRVATRTEIAGRQLSQFLWSYVKLVDTADTSSSTVSDGTSQSLAPRIARQVLQVLRAFAASAVVVVAAEIRHMPTVLTITVPNRPLHFQRELQANIMRPHTWHRVMRGGWILPRAYLQVDLLMPSADADRRVQVTLDGVTFDPSQPPGRAAELDIVSGPPLPAHQLYELVQQLTTLPPSWPPAFYQGLAELAEVKADSARESLREYLVARDLAPPDLTTDGTDEFRGRLDALSKELADISMDSSSASASGPLVAAWAGGNWLKTPLRRRTSTELVSPDIVTARARMIEAPSQRAAPTRASIGVHVAVTDSEYTTVMSSWGWLSVVLMSVVLTFFVSEKLVVPHSQPINPDVLAFVLGLSTAIQAGRIGRPESGTMRGLLMRGGELLTVTLILPTAVLAIGVAFSSNISSAIIWAAGCLSLQLLTQVLLRTRLRMELSRPNDAWSQSSLSLCTDSFDYSHIQALHSTWWRSITADVLIANRPAYGYVAWQRAASPKPIVLANSDDLLAMQHWGVGEQSLTFAVFRDRPDVGEDVTDGSVTEVDLDPDQLGLGGPITDIIRIFLGLGQGLVPVAHHPVTAVLKAAATCRLTVIGAHLPVSPPAAAYVDLRWARVEIALRDGDIDRLVAMLSDVRRLTMTNAHSDRHASPPPIVGIQTSTRGVARLLNPRPAEEPTAPVRSLLASDLDVVAASGVDLVERMTAATWRVMALGAESLIGAEGAILCKFDPGLRLAGLTTATIYGKTIILLVGHQPSERDTIDKPLRKSLGNGERMIIYLDKRQTRQDLGSEPVSPLLEAHIWAPSQPSMTLAMLESLRGILNDMTAVRLGEGQNHGWYPRAVSIANGVADAQFTARLEDYPTASSLADELSSWGPVEFARISRRVLALTASKIAAFSPAEGDPTRRAQGNLAISVGWAAVV